MKKWIVEDWGFELIAIEGNAANCRLGIEKDDKFTFSYECPNGMLFRLSSRERWHAMRCDGEASSLPTLRLANRSFKRSVI